jgi:hypothetical protein
MAEGAEASWCHHGSGPAPPEGCAGMQKCHHGSRLVSSGEVVRTDGCPAADAGPWRRNDLGEAGWRIEVCGRGQYWMWRRGHGRNRKSRYGGRFELLPTERQAAYFENVRKRAHSRNGAGDLSERRAGAPTRGRDPARAWHREATRLPVLCRSGDLQHLASTSSEAPGSESPVGPRPFRPGPPVPPATR